MVLTLELLKQRILAEEAEILRAMVREEYQRLRQHEQVALKAIGGKANGSSQ